MLTYLHILKSLKKGYYLPERIDHISFTEQIKTKPKFNIKRVIQGDLKNFKMWKKQEQKVQTIH